MDRRFPRHRFKDNRFAEFAALRISMDKKEFNEINDSLKKNYFDGTVCERSFINGITKKETSVIDGAIRDNFAIKFWYEEFISRAQDGIWSK